MKLIIFDFETSNKRNGSAFDPSNYPVFICCIFINNGIERLYYHHFYSDVHSNCTFTFIKNLFENNKNALLIGHNIKFDIHWLNRLGVPHSELYFDTMFPPYIWQEGIRKKGTLSLSALSKKLGQSKQTLGDLLIHKHGLNPAELLPQWVASYGVQDVIATKQLFFYQKDRIDKTQKAISAGFIKNKNLYNAPIQLMNDLLPYLIEAEQNGFLVDVKKLKEIKVNEEAHRTVLVQKILDDLLERYKIEHFNIKSSNQISHFVYSLKLRKEGKDHWKNFFTNFKDFEVNAEEKLKLKIEECFEKLEYGLNIQPTSGALGKTSLSVSRDTLKELIQKNKEHPGINILKQFYEISRLETLINTFIGDKDAGKGTLGHIFYGSNSDGNNFLHTSYNQCIAATGRLTSSGPNLQNWPREETFPIRSCIISRFKEGHIADPDASQLELRYAGWYYNEPTMRKDYENGIDIHNENTLKAFGEGYTEENRSITKQTTFKIIYRGTAWSIVRDQKIPIWDITRAKEIVDAIYERYDKLKAGQETDLSSVKNVGSLSTPTGRVFRFNLAHFSLKNKVANYPIQSGATADLIPCAMIVLLKKFREEKLRSKIMGNVHDSLPIDVYPGEEQKVKEISIWAMTDGAKEEWERRFGFSFNFPLETTFKIKEHW